MFLSRLRPETYINEHYTAPDFYLSGKIPDSSFSNTQHHITL